MNSVWLEDLVALSECLNFSKAAERRHVTQPAFGRRIRAFEEWCGQPLVDRSSHRLELTDAGRLTLAAAQDILRRTNALQRELSEIESSTSSLTFASTQALSFTFFPEWFRDVSSLAAGASVHLLSDNMRACERIMEDGRAQFLLCHAHPSSPMELPAAHYSRIELSCDRLVPVMAAGTTAWLDDLGKGPMPFLGFDHNSGLGRILNSVLGARRDRLPLQTVFTSHLAMALKTMVAEGKGMAWIPVSLIRQELDAGSIRLAGGDDWAVDVSIVLLRPRSRMSPLAERFWAGISKAG
ncbi:MULTISPECIES: LysR substrate-binding domain-containing protein [unclassified Paracoccus (in: a-proteobacteria)]|uniref:LysR substrate-binding domain-containing protein n=1 Tax=unclassified Paracoccus (in: a-proteobacteria) TaxID=2688777 RepID=UPI0015FEFCAA|nr:MULTISPECIES: LysR substrate-binding domain-containing protein [unclassified Paracoccus (in: a-proteobacteria)]MBB1493255.1 LysR family transcriptional regulator [Paracoccus sp. MC1854]MBB1499186.1 LysR family transcriptional regulator [Paracoccus sp. MC1862]QQO45781.1 LysR family transcriptional regulator [Paracoccus sp. MC1862]